MDGMRQVRKYWLYLYCHINIIYICVYVYYIYIYILLLVCGGGVWFDQAETGKETIENAQLFQLALKLARLEQELEQRNGK